jgi:ankyrin repeat protein
VEALLKGAGNVNVTDEDGMICLHILAYKTCAMCLVYARWLLNRGTDTNKQDCKGMTPLHDTACSGKCL